MGNRHYIDYTDEELNNNKEYIEDSGFPLLLNEEQGSALNYFYSYLLYNTQWKPYLEMSPIEKVKFLEYFVLHYNSIQVSSSNTAKRHTI